MFPQEKSSVIYHFGDGEEAEEMTGAVGIQKTLESRMARDWEVNLDTGCVDAQHSADNGVMLMVTGTIGPKTGASKQVSLRCNCSASGTFCLAC